MMKLTSYTLATVMGLAAPVVAMDGPATPPDQVKAVVLLVETEEPAPRTLMAPPTANQPNGRGLLAAPESWFCTVNWSCPSKNQTGVGSGSSSNRSDACHRAKADARTQASRRCEGVNPYLTPEDCNCTKQDVHRKRE